MQLDFRSVILAVWMPAFLWVLGVAGATLSGYPGVVCVTPLGWLLGLNVGQRCVGMSSSQAERDRVIEAGLAGALLGILQGILFTLVLFFATPMGIPGGSIWDAVGVGVISLLVAGAGSMLGCSLLSVGMAIVLVRRQRNEPTNFPPV